MRRFTMRRFVIVVASLVAVLLLGAPSAPAMRQTAPRPAPALKLSGGTLRWSSLPGVLRYVVATVEASHTTLRVVSGTRFHPRPLPGRTVAYKVRARAGRARWSHAVKKQWARVGRPTEDPGRLKVSVQN